MGLPHAIGDPLSVADPSPCGERDLCATAEMIYSQPLDWPGIVSNHGTKRATLVSARSSDS